MNTLRVKRAVALLLALLLAVGSAFTGPSTEVQAAAKAPTKITLNSKNKVIVKGKTFKLKVASTKPAKASKSVTFKSTKPKIASVSSKGVIKGLKKGTATIQVVSKLKKSVKATCKVQVAAKAVKSINVSAAANGTITVDPGKSITIKPSVSPKDSIAEGYTYTIQDKAIATVTSKGKITGKTSGTTTLTIKETGSKKSLKLTVNVTGTETPATQAPASETANSQTPATQTPASETMNSQTPATQTPASETADSQKPTDSQKPADSQTPTDSQKPADSQTPTDSQKPADSQAPADSQKPADSEAPADSQTPADSQAPADSQTPADSEIPDPNELEVYVSENFETQTAGQIIKSAGKDEDVPTPVKRGDITYTAGKRGNGSINCTANVATDNGNYLSIDEAGEATSGRGIGMTFDGIPTASQLAEGEILELSMDVNSSHTFQILGMNWNDTATDGGFAVPTFGTGNKIAGSNGGYAHLRVIIDPANQKQYVIITEKNGSILHLQADDLKTADATFTAVTFYTGNTKAKIDNIKIAKRKADVAPVTINVKTDNDASLAEAIVTISSYQILTGETGIITVGLPDGKHTITANRTGWEHTAGKGDADSKEITVAATPQTVELILLKQVYDQYPGVVTVSGGQSFITAPKGDAEAVTTAAFSGSVLDQLGLPMTEGFTPTWRIYPSGTEVADPNVTIDENGVVTVAPTFNIEGTAKIAAYDVIYDVASEDKYEKGMQTLYIGANDIIYYDILNWNTNDGRNGGIDFASALTPMPDICSVTVKLAFPSGAASGGQVTMFLTANGSALEKKGTHLTGIQLSGDTKAIKAWTGWEGKYGKLTDVSAFNQWDDVDKLTNSGVILEDYDNKEISVTFVLDNVNKTVTASCNGGEAVNLPYVNEPTSLNGIFFGTSDKTKPLTVTDVTIQEPDNDYLAVLGTKGFAKISGQTVTRSYALGQSVIVPDETFHWTVEGSNTNGITINDGVLSVEDTAAAGKYTISAASSINENKKASLEVEIGDFAQFETSNVVVSGARAYADGIDTAGKYEITKAVDSYGDDVVSQLPAAVWSSDNSSIIDVQADGTAEVKGAGTAKVTATITNGTAVTTVDVPVTVAKYYITAEATGNSTAIDATGLISSDNIKGYQVTTAKDGKLVKQNVVTTVPATVDTTGADKVEIAPIFEYDCGYPGKRGKLGTGVDIMIPADTYNFTVQDTGERCDVYVNSQILVNNILQDGNAIDTVEVHDIVVREGIAKITVDDYKSKDEQAVDTIKIKVSAVKAPSIVDRTKKVYVLGDSLVCTYYNGGNASNNYKTGWGQVLAHYLTDDVEVVNLANSGAHSGDLLRDAFTQVSGSAQAGDIMVLESGYNDKTYIPESAMRANVKAMVDRVNEIGAVPVLVSPNASSHSYGENVAWTSVMTDLATQLNTKYVNLSKMSWDFLEATYQGDRDLIGQTYNVSDRLHSTYHGANKWASFVGTGLANAGLGDIVNTEYTYEYTDSKGNKITCQAEKAAN